VVCLIYREVLKFEDYEQVVGSKVLIATTTWEGIGWREEDGA
jgi:hypothetical protein